MMGHLLLGRFLVLGVEGISESFLIGYGLEINLTVRRGADIFFCLL